MSLIDPRDQNEDASEATSTSPAAGAGSQIGSPNMDMLKGERDRRGRADRLAQAGPGTACPLPGRRLRRRRPVRRRGGRGGRRARTPPERVDRHGYVDLKLVSDDAIYRDDDGTEHVVEWLTQQDVDLARRITEIAADHEVAADPASVSVIELGLDTAHSATIAPVWAALLTGDAEAQGRGTPSDEIRDATGRVPNLWFGDADEHETPRQRFHVEVYVAPEVAEQRIAAAVAAGGTVVDDSDAPSLTVIADQDGNTGVICVGQSPARKG